MIELTKENDDKKENSEKRILISVRTPMGKASISISGDTQSVNIELDESTISIPICLN